jgi:phospholipid/cholesterol/gamma-HCH transport system substrate-binding protein
MSFKRALIATVVAGVLIGTLVAAAGGGDDGGYKVRAIFDNASFIIPGEDVKVAGVKVGKIADIDLTEQNKAAVVLSIDDPAFTPFRKDAHCQIRLQSLIGEQYIECEPTAPRDESKPAPPELPAIASGDAEGQHLLQVENTTTPVPVDLINNITRLPEQQRLRLIINEFGAGLAGNGPALRAALRRANPALKEFDQLIAILASQNRLLGRLVDESEAALTPFADKRKQFAGFIDNAGALAAATAERGDDLERNFERLPAFLREFQPTADRLSSLADQFKPALDSLESQAPAINKTVERTGPFFAAATPAVKTLGDFAEEGRTLFPEIRPLVHDIGDLGKPLKPTTTDLAELLGSVDDTGGIEELLRFIYFYTNATNGEDQIGHYLRAQINPSACAQRIGTPVGGCEGTFLRDSGAAATRAAAAAKMPREPEAMLDYLLSQQEGDQ